MYWCSINKEINNIQNIYSSFNSEENIRNINKNSIDIENKINELDTLYRSSEDKYYLNNKNKLLLDEKIFFNHIDGSILFSDTTCHAIK